MGMPDFSQLGIPVINIMESKEIVLGVKSSILLVKNCLAKHTPDYNDFDAIMHAVTKSSKASQLVYENFEYRVAQNEIIQVDPHIEFQLRSIIRSDDGAITKSMECILTSETKDIEYLRSWIRKCRTDYISSRSNKISEGLKYFDQVTTNSLLPHLTFRMSDFTTDRNFDNIFFEEKEEVITRLKLFRDNPEWYAARGIPRKCGFLLDGSPGTGKTSLCKSAASECKRHIFNIRAGSIKSNDKLQGLFHNPVVHVVDPITNNIDRIIIPIEQRLYLIEDIDTMTDIIRKREYKSHSTSPPPAALPKKSSKFTGDNLEDYMASAMNDEMAEVKEAKKEEETEDIITLDSLLNVLDGVLETPGRLLFMTTNHPEIIDEALIRPGRIDKKIHFGNCTRTMLFQMHNHFYKHVPNTTTQESFLSVPERSISPCDWESIMLSNIMNPQKAIADLLSRSGFTAGGNIIITGGSQIINGHFGTTGTTGTR